MIEALTWIGIAIGMWIGWSIIASVCAIIGMAAAYVVIVKVLGR